MGVIGILGDAKETQIRLRVFDQLTEHEIVQMDAESFATASFDVVGVYVDPALSQQAIPRCDLVDGLAKETGSLSLIMYQYTGTDSRMLIGFNTQVSGIVRASRAVLDRPAGKALILGGRQIGASALAALVQMKASTIAVAPRSIAGPGSAQGAAHRLGLDVLAYSEDDLVGHLDEFDTVILGSSSIRHDLHTELGEFSGLVVEAVPMEGTDDIDPSAIHVPFRDVLERQIEDDIRVLTGVNPNNEALRAAVDNAYA